MNVLNARRVGETPGQWAGETEDGRPVYGRYVDNSLHVYVGPEGSKAGDTPAALREKPILALRISTYRARDYAEFRSICQAHTRGHRQIFWPEHLQGDPIMVSRAEFLDLDRKMAEAIEVKFVSEQMSAPLAPASQRILERAAGEALGRWVRAHAKQDGSAFRICLSDEEGLPNMEFVVSGWHVVMDPDEGAWVKIVWEKHK